MTAPPTGSNIFYFTEDIEFCFSNVDVISSWLNCTAQEEGQKIEYLNIVFCSDEYLLEINRQYLNHDYYTDIITFDYGETDIQGELFISIDRVRENAKSFKIDFETELHRVMIHGLLHICGYGDKRAEEITIIRQREDYYLSKR